MFVLLYSSVLHNAYNPYKVSTLFQIRPATLSGIPSAVHTDLFNFFFLNCQKKDDYKKIIIKIEERQCYMIYDLKNTVTKNVRALK